MHDLTRFHALIGEPVGSIDDDLEGWARLEGRLGLRFPEDFKEICSAYGPAFLSDYARLPHPRGVGGYGIEDMIDTRSSIMDAGIPDFDYPFYPRDADGLFACGDSIGGSIFFFDQRVGEPESWPVVVFSDSYNKSFVFYGSYGDFLYTLLSWKLGPCPFDGLLEGPMRDPTVERRPDWLVR